MHYFNLILENVFILFSDQEKTKSNEQKRTLADDLPLAERKKKKNVEKNKIGKHTETQGKKDMPVVGNQKRALDVDDSPPVERKKPKKGNSDEKKDIEMQNTKSIKSEKNKTTKKKEEMLNLNHLTEEAPKGIKPFLHGTIFQVAKNSL